MNRCNYSLDVWIAVSIYVDGISSGNLLFLAFYIIVFIYIYIYIYTHTHTHTHTYIYICILFFFFFCSLRTTKCKWFTPLIRKPVYVQKGV
jgi:hypothetical protein